MASKQYSEEFIQKMLWSFVQKAVLRVCRYEDRQINSAVVIDSDRRVVLRKSLKDFIDNVIGIYAS